MSFQKIDILFVYKMLANYFSIMMATLVPTEHKLYQKRVNEYKKYFRHFLLTSRFNNHTWSENAHFRQTHSQYGCVYCAPDPVSASILEMNNDTNKIMGIGMVRNHPLINKWTVYDNQNYNRYMFKGKTRIDRSEMSTEEERIFTVFDILCFTGNKHMKRGQGLKAFPADMLYRCMSRLDLLEFIVDMFKRRLSENATGPAVST
jgi:hypothetical protein